MELHLDRLPRSVELVRDGEGPLFRYVDERLLPHEVSISETRDWQSVIEAIKCLAVRGAPAIGIAGAAAMALWSAYDGKDVEQAAAEIASARPTAVNLRWGVNRALEKSSGIEGDAQTEMLYTLVKLMEAEDEETNRAIGRNGSALIDPGSRILTHCNAGSLATCYFGTALGVVYSAAAEGKVERVYADETRPVGQGARLTAWELAQVGIPVTLICDNMAASLMAAGNVDAVIVGADRIARNGDAANKIGTYGVAILAKEHGIPFYVAAPFSTVDAQLADGSGIVIEQRPAQEVLPEPIDGVDVWNPAFDVTPARYITKIVTEKGAFSPEELEARL
ncbi:MAG: S-methyl-5-thioribose-1-phosphate isomerase [Eggerthellaceae bacterium]|nr:S-methyl-5-thioribose-1-phosphate isomerase [Eggerthellaceae bacterium]